MGTKHRPERQPDSWAKGLLPTLTAMFSTSNERPARVGGPTAFRSLGMNGKVFVSSFSSGNEYQLFLNRLLVGTEPQKAWSQLVRLWRKKDISDIDAQSTYLFTRAKQILIDALAIPSDVKEVRASALEIEKLAVALMEALEKHPFLSDNSTAELYPVGPIRPRRRIQMLAPEMDGAESDRLNRLIASPELRELVEKSSPEPQELYPSLISRDELGPKGYRERSLVHYYLTWLKVSSESTQRLGPLLRDLIEDARRIGAPHKLGQDHGTSLQQLYFECQIAAMLEREAGKPCYRVVTVFSHAAFGNFPDQVAIERRLRKLKSKKRNT